MKLNTHLPPVGCPLLVKMPWGGRLVRAERTGHITNKNSGYEVRFEDGSTHTRRWEWTYP